MCTVVAQGDRDLHAGHEGAGRGLRAVGRLRRARRLRRGRSARTARRPAVRRARTRSRGRRVPSEYVEWECRSAFSSAAVVGIGAILRSRGAGFSPRVEALDQARHRLRLVVMQHVAGVGHHRLVRPARQRRRGGRSRPHRRPSLWASVSVPSTHSTGQAIAAQQACTSAQRYSTGLTILCAGSPATRQRVAIGRRRRPVAGEEGRPLRDSRGLFRRSRARHLGHRRVVAQAAAATSVHRSTARSAPAPARVAHRAGRSLRG
jgi:hypothetical protein